MIQTQKELKINHMPFKVGQTLAVTGVPNANATDRFSVNIGPNDQDIALHVNPRFQSKTVVCNTREGANWGQEIIGKGLPFQQGVEFTITIAFNCGEFVITLPDSSMIHVPNRLGAYEYIHFFSDGEVRISSLQIK
ncbi:beta-galactoside-binding lectin-like [Synchiropus splendidus]|uniref:beta-galactoside-binding lectin-like n=1 Tax=Synchiropus splendidus TaxID=270530 RepID=UPI00237D3EAF|nr:beta-galactoside-binding lectin-like [Synchiropus splendidus]